MTNRYDNQTIIRSGDVGSLNMGLRDFFTKVYGYMSGGLLVTGITAFFVASNPAVMQILFESSLVWLLFIGQIGLVAFLSIRIHRISTSAASMLFWLYAFTLGLTLSSIFYVYTGASITRVFLITSATFSGISLYGYTTKKDLTSFGSFLFMGLIGLIVATVVNFFLKSDALTFMLSYIGLGVFIGLAAYDTQRLKDMYHKTAGDVEAHNKSAIMGALALYLDFINIFLYLLRIMGDRR